MLRAKPRNRSEVESRSPVYGPAPPMNTVVAPVSLLNTFRLRRRLSFGRRFFRSTDRLGANPVTASVLIALGWGLARGCDAPNPVIGQSSNLVPALLAHPVPSRTPFAS